MPSSSTGLSSLPASFADLLTLENPSPNEYVSAHAAQSASWFTGDQFAYGGHTLAVAVKASYATVEDTHRLLSCLGSFLSPAFPGAKLQAKVTIVRDTRAFATRRVEVFQQQRGATKLVASMQLEFQRRESHAMLTYSAAPKMRYSPPESSWDEARVRQYARDQGAREKILPVRNENTSIFWKYFDVRYVPEAFNAETMAGLLPHLGKAQKHLSITEKTSCVYWRAKGALPDHQSQAAALTFILDAGMPVTPVAFSGIDLRTIGVVTSIDFAVRFFTNDLDVNDWVMREEQTVAGGEGRTYSEARVWDANGKMVAGMSQQCLLRPRKVPTKGKKEEKEKEDVKRTKL